MLGWCRHRWGRRCFTCRTIWARSLVTCGKGKGSSEPYELPVWVWDSQVLDNITHMHEIRAFPMLWGGRGCGMRLELKIFLLKEFLFLSPNHCQWCCHCAWTGGDKILVGIRSCALGCCGIICQWGVEKALSRGSGGVWAGAVGAFCAGGKGELP